MHVMIQSDFLLLVNIVLFRKKNQIGQELRVAVESTYTDNDIPEIDIKGFPTNDYLFVLEGWTVRKMLINNLVQLPCIFV